MNVKTSGQNLVDVEAEVLAIGVFDGDPGAPAALAGTPLGDTFARLVEAKDLSGSVGEVAPLLGLPAGGIKAKAVVALGLGKREKFDAGVAFAAGVAAGKKLAGKARGQVAVALPDAGDRPAVASALIEGLTVGTRGPGLRKAEPNRHEFAGLTLVDTEGASPDVEAAATRGAIVGEAVNLARDLANTPPAEKTPTALAARAREAAEAAGLTVTVWDEARIRNERFGGLLGVAAGSEEPPAFVILEHKGGGDGPTLALVGKGVTFDSGGLSLKPSASMEDMKADMTGAAVVLATMVAAARLGLKANLVGYLALTENMVNGKAMRLGDVLTMRNGKTVEVMNTDAEGRLILADALSYAAEQEPDRILDLATLTGACMVALGTKVAGLFGNDPGFAGDVLAASKRTGERAWQLPLDDDFLEQLKSPVADLKNVGTRWGGSITAAKFLEQFVAERPWVHLDIAGPSWADSESGTRDAGGTGCFVRTLIALIQGEAGTA
ncbi:leucyl aminopeptidase [Tundrisphaera sp. TA3]|uniref:leucyl aminopeptidase n=1 Tax=Tundrisphaera sp. TA3 TaxID=3435775 RepID=UPI003EBA687B